MSKKIRRRLFVVIQPLQYLQAMELFCCEEERILIVPWANKENQLYKLIDEKDWHKIIWVKFSGTALDLVLNRRRIRRLMSGLGNFDEVVISAYYNEFMNAVANWNYNARKILLEDGNATLTLDKSSHYQGLKYRLKHFACKAVGFDISPVNNVTMFLLDRPNEVKVPSIASNVMINKFSRLRSELEDYKSEETIYFISSAFINADMIDKDSYVGFLIRLANKYSDNKVKILLHRFDRLEDFSKLSELQNVEVIESTGPVEIYFQEKKVYPEKVITAGSGATETLELIYGVGVKVIMPDLATFKPECRSNVRILIDHLNEAYEVNFL